MITVFMRTLIIYMILIGAIRLMGKRQIGELQVSELVITFMLSELAVIPIQDTNIPVAYAIIPILLLLAMEVIVSFILTKSSRLKVLFSGKPSILIRRGKLNQKELVKLRMGVNELLSELRLKDIASIEDVEYAIVEENGKLSVFPKAAKATLTPSDMNLSPTENGIAHPIIIDGEISRINLELAGKNEPWLSRLLKEKKVQQEDIFLMTADDSGNINIIKKDKSQ